MPIPTKQAAKLKPPTVAAIIGAKFVTDEDELGAIDPMGVAGKFIETEGMALSLLVSEEESKVVTIDGLLDEIVVMPD